MIKCWKIFHKHYKLFKTKKYFVWYHADYFTSKEYSINNLIALDQLELKNAKKYLIGNAR